MCLSQLSQDFISSAHDVTASSQGKCGFGSKVKCWFVFFKEFFIEKSRFKPITSTLGLFWTGGLPLMSQHLHKASADLDQKSSADLFFYRIFYWKVKVQTDYFGAVLNRRPSVVRGRFKVLRNGKYQVLKISERLKSMIVHHRLSARSFACIGF